MSNVVEYRQRVIDWLKASFPALSRDVDIYDGIFDEKDIAEWSNKAVSLRVATIKAPTVTDSTGNLVAELRAYVVVIIQDGRKGRDSDPRCWQVIEDIAKAALFQEFGDPNSGRATEIDFSRIGNPQLRRDGIAVGVVEWRTMLNVGVNRVEEREFIRDPETGMPIPLPPTLIDVESVTQRPFDYNAFLGTRVEVEDDG